MSGIVGHIGGHQMIRYQPSDVSRLKFYHKAMTIRVFIFTHILLTIFSQSEKNSPHILPEKIR